MPELQESRGPLAFLMERLRVWRNDALLARYRRTRPPALDDFLARNAHLAGGRIALVIAFEQPWALRWLLRMAATNLVGMQVLVFDNSRDAGMREQLRALCEVHGVPYLALPRYRTQHANRSHGMAMSWVWHNVVRALQPEMFGFLDHDMIPVRPVDPGERLQGQEVFGLLNAGKSEQWSLWAGYCFYRFPRVAGKRLNFLYDFARGLDTGGRNWKPLYRGLEREGLRLARQEFMLLQPPSTAPARPVEVLDGAWIHIGGVSYNDNFERKHVFFEALLRALEAGTPLEQLKAPGA
jgi:hypothetical protein